MRIQVNLATRPFVELRPFFARLRLIMVALALVALVFAVVLHFQKAKLAAAESQMDDLRLRTDTAQRERLNNEAAMRQPANAAVLDRAHFLNELFLRKSFSWTAVMMDLENVLPTGVQVSSIQPAVTADGEVVIQLRVSGDRDRAIQLVRNLERSTRFLAPKLVGESTQTKEGGGATSAANSAGAAPAGVDFDIIANYNPLPDFAQTLAEAKRVQHEAATTRPVAAVTPPAAQRPAVVLKPFAPARPQAAAPQPASRPAAQASPAQNQDEPAIHLGPLTPYPPHRPLGAPR